MAYPRYTRSRQHGSARRTSGNITLNGTSWGNVDTGIDITLNEVQVDDVLEAGVSMWIDNEAVDAHFDVVTVVGGTPTNSFAARGAVPTTLTNSEGVQAWYATASAKIGIGGAAPLYTVVAGDLSTNSVTLRLRYATATATNRTLRAVAANPLDFWVKNLGPAQ